jgi:predicted O-methyltransferase YrrM
MSIYITNQVLDNFDLINRDYLVAQDFYDLKSGQQEYRLYSYLTTFFNNITILDIGTCQGRSAVALSYNSSNRVISYDIEDHIKNSNHKIYTKSNIEFRIKNVLDDLTEDFIKNVKIVMIDIDHFEKNELMILNRLREIKFSGIILLDDIKNHYDISIKQAMDKLWQGITEKKYDVTQYGHWSGTGLVIMNSDIDIVLG